MMPLSEKISSHSGKQVFFGVFFLSLFFNGISQIGQKQNNNWRYGEYSSINFNSTRQDLSPLSPLNVEGGSAAVSDINTGALLFYSDGTTIWDVNNLPMPNGSGLTGGQGAGPQEVIIVPRPFTPGIYYLFTIGNPPGTATGFTAGLRYNIVDMHLRNGLGDVVQGEKNKLLLPRAWSRLTAVPNCDHTGYWLLAINEQTEKFNAFEITQAGINTVAVESEAIPTFGSSLGSLKVNRQLNKLAYGVRTSAYLFDFNNATGKAGDYKQFLYSALEAVPYGFEFSPDGSRLYIANGKQLMQFDITLPGEFQIAASKYVLFTRREPGAGPHAPAEIGPPGPHGIEYAPDGRIFFQTGAVQSIINPNGLGPAVSLSRFAVPGAGAGGFALPSWIYTLENEIRVSDTCYSSGTKFHILDSLQTGVIDWDFGDPVTGISNAGAGIKTTHIFSSPGSYTVKATIHYTCGSTRLLTRVVNILDCCTAPGSQWLDFSYKELPVCTADGNVLPAKGEFFAGGGSFSAGPGLSLDPLTGSINTTASTAGSYQVRYSVQPPSCPGPIAGIFLLQLNTTPDAPVVTSAPGLCGGLRPGGPLTATGQNLLWYDLPAPWPPLAGAPVPNASTYGIQTWEVTQTVNGCESARATASFTMIPPPMVDAGPPQMVAPYDEPVTLTGTASQGLSLVWQPGGFISPEVTVRLFTNTWFHLAGTSSLGCSASDSILVLVHRTWRFPNVFTPNGDGVNDRWPTIAEGHSELKIDVYNRQGQPVFNWHGSGPLWDGTYKSRPLPVGTYYWILEPGDGGPVQSGFVDILR
jgi:gliding motility-associated-like protein